MTNKKYDVVIGITSYKRFDQCYRLIDQLLNQKTLFNYKIVLINDGSDDIKYDIFNNLSDKILYIDKKVNKGKMGYYETINHLWSEVKKIDTNYFLQMDDDFILCNHFLDKLFQYYNIEKLNNTELIALCPHLYSFDKNNVFYDNLDSVDGVGLFDIKVLKYLNYQIQRPLDNVKLTGVSVGFWQNLNKATKKLQGKIKRLSFSLVYHDNTNGSAMHGDFRKTKNIFTHNYFGFLSHDVYEYDKNIVLLKKIVIPPAPVVSPPATLKEKRKIDKENSQKRAMEYEKEKILNLNKINLNLDRPAKIIITDKNKIKNMKKRNL